MKKVNDFRGFYEDEESEKMLNAIHRAYRKDKIERYERKESIKTKVIVGLVIVAVLLILGLVLVHIGKENNEMVNQCVNSGKSLHYCQNKYLM